jgi:hypothetical protein
MRARRSVWHRRHWSRVVPFLGRWFSRPSAQRPRGRRLTGCETLETRRLLTAESAFVWTPTAEGEAPGAMPDFSLVDVNPNSARSGDHVSPRDYQQQVSAYYFGYGL